VAASPDPLDPRPTIGQVRRRISVVAGLVACTVAGAAPALAGDAATHQALPGRVAADDGHGRDLNPQHTSGDEPGQIAMPVPSYLRGAVTSTPLATWKVAPGVHYTRWSQTNVRGPIVAHLLTIKSRKPGVSIDYAGLGPVRRVGSTTDILAVDKAIAGVNGDFFDIGRTGAPLGLGLDRQRGLLHARQDGWNNAFFIKKNGKPDIGNLPMVAKLKSHPGIKITNLNSPFVTPGGIGVYTSTWGKTAGYAVTQGQKKNVRMVKIVSGRVVRKSTKLKADKAIPGTVLVGRGPGARQLGTLKKGDRVKIGYHLQGRPQMAISGNRFLVHDGIIRVVDDTELHPRTAIGIDDDTGEVLLLVVDGRSKKSRGYTMVELANLMIDLGADEAINLDGGGSSTLVGKNRKGNVKVLNTPSDGAQRRVANAIEVTFKKPKG
jgi:hypothetical protein